MKLAKREPVAIRTAVTAVVVAVVHCLVVFGVIDVDAEGAIVGTVDAVGALVLILWVRPVVTPNAKVVARVSRSTGTIVAGDAAMREAGTPLLDYATSGRTRLPGINLDPRALSDAGGANL